MLQSVSVSSSSAPFAPSRLACLALVYFAAACGEGEGAHAATQQRDLAEALEVARTIELEESDSVINVAPEVVVDPQGGFLIADGREAQLRRYDSDGRVLWTAGRRGSGPGEFQNIQVVDRLPDGRIITADWQSRLTIFDETADSVLVTQETQLSNIEDIAVLSDSLVVLSAMGLAPDSPRVHVYNLRRQSVVRSFFTPFTTFANRNAAVVTGFSRFDLRADTLAITFAPSDTVYLYLLDGRPVARVPLPSARFRRVGATSGDTNDNARAWLGTFDIVADVYWLKDGSLLASYQSIHPEAAMARDWHLLHMRRGDDTSVEIFDAPRLLTVGANADSLFLVSPAAEVPNQWLVGVLRSPSSS